MLFIIDDQLKVVFGWSAKCGCTHVKKMALFLIEDSHTEDFKNIHTPKFCCELPKDIENYTTILFIRNPFERIVSGFLDKYRPKKYNPVYFESKWIHEKKTFSFFVEELIKGDYEMVEEHHFTPQTSEKFNKWEILKSKTLKIFDIKNIDYSYLEQHYQKMFPAPILQFRGDERKMQEKLGTFDKEFVYDVEMEEYFLYKVPLRAFYNTQLIQKVGDFYQEDLSFFSEMGFHYPSPL